MTGSKKSKNGLFIIDTKTYPIRQQVARSNMDQNDAYTTNSRPFLQLPIFFNFLIKFLKNNLPGPLVCDSHVIRRDSFAVESCQER